MKYSFLLLSTLLSAIAGCANENGTEPGPILTSDESRAMTEDEFWELIDTVDTDAIARGDEETAVEPLVEALAAFPPDKIKHFEDHLATVLYRLDGRRYADNAGQSGQSSDGFLYSRCYVVGCGRQQYKATLDDPEQMPKSIDHWFESLLYASQEAWSVATGKDREDWDFEASVSYETGSNKTQW